MLLFECCGTGRRSQCSDLPAISAAHTSSVWRVFSQWKMTAMGLKEDMVLLGVVIQHSWRAHNCLWHNVKSSQSNVSGFSFLANWKLGTIRKSKTLINYHLLISLEGVKWSSRQLSERPSICLQMEVLNTKIFFHFMSSSAKECVSSCRGVCDITLSL